MIKNLDIKKCENLFNGKSIMITGGTGSFGNMMTQVILENFKPNRLIIFSS